MQLISNSETDSDSATFYIFDKWELVMANPLMVWPEAVKHPRNSLMTNEFYIMSFNWKYAVHTERAKQ